MHGVVNMNERDEIIHNKCQVILNEMKKAETEEQRVFWLKNIRNSVIGNSLKKSIYANLELPR